MRSKVGDITQLLGRKNVQAKHVMKFHIILGCMHKFFKNLINS